MDTNVSVLVCHANRLLADCLTHALTDLFNAACRIVEIKQILDNRVDLVADALLLLLDGSIADSESHCIIERVRHANPTCRVLLLVSGESTNRVIALAKLGAEGCVFEDVSVDELWNAIEQVLSGHTYCSPQVANALFATVGKQGAPPWSEHLDNVRLTAREREVLELIAWERLGNKQIGRRLSISLYTVKNHVHNIIEKLDVQDRHEAADVATRRRLLVTAR